MGTSLGPIEALPGEGSTRAAKRVNIDAEIGEPGATSPAEFVVAFAAWTDNLGLFERVREFDSDAASEMVVAGARRVHIVRDARTRCREWGTRKSGDRPESFERVRDVRPGHRVIAMSAGAANGEQTAVHELRKMRTGGLSRNIRG